MSMIATVAHSSPILALVGQLNSWTEPPGSSLAFACCPFRFEFNCSLAFRCVVAKAAPLPILRALTESRSYWIPVNVTQLLHKLRIVSDVEVVISLLPEV